MPAGTAAGGKTRLRCAQWPGRGFAVEGPGGLGRSLVQQLADAGENVVDMPSTLSAKARLLATGGDRKTDPADVLHVAQAASFHTDLRRITAEDQPTILRLLAERHEDLTGERTRIVNLFTRSFGDCCPVAPPHGCRQRRPRL
ncbi:transposase [Streptomyces albiflaviniger]|nr:transposase [Streptomyces albiflaviniger]